MRMLGPRGSVPSTGSALIILYPWGPVELMPFVILICLSKGKCQDLSETQLATLIWLTLVVNAVYEEEAS